MDNPIIEVYRGRSIRRYNTLRIRVSSVEFKRYIDAKIDFGLSERQALVEKKLLCEKCSAALTPEKSECKPIVR